MATFLGVNEAYIWPDALGKDEIAAVSRSEVVAMWPHRWAVPRDTWGHFFSKAEREIGALVYSGMFMAEDIGVHKLFAERARAGVRVWLLLGDPDSPNVAERGAAEGIDDTMAAKVRTSIMLFRKLLAEPGVELRLHGTVLYNSIYRADERLLANQHTYGSRPRRLPSSA